MRRKYLQKAKKKNLLLADGTKVILNSDTKLIIPSNFNKEERIIEMEGEGFFDVTPNPDKPFIIRSGEARVKVLGTSFDFKSYKEDEFIKLTVSTGKSQSKMLPTKISNWPFHRMNIFQSIK